jgi:dinuclear metal center YbgI/SA1388 family protein
MNNIISLTELESYLIELLNPFIFNDRAYNGVQVATRVPIARIATAVSITKEVICKAIENKVQAIIVHHGIFCKNDAHPLVGRLYDYIELLIKNDIALLCYHLPLDAHVEVGNNWKAAADLGLQSLQPCIKYGDKDIGVMGSIDTMSFIDFQQKVEKYYGRPAEVVQVHDRVNTIVIVSGAGERSIKEAAQRGADCLITGRVDEHVWQDAHEYGVSFLGLGHYATEVIGPKALAEKLKEKFEIPVQFIETDNPF